MRSVLRALISVPAMSVAIAAGMTTAATASAPPSAEKPAATKNTAAPTAKHCVTFTDTQETTCADSPTALIDTKGGICGSDVKGAKIWDRKHFDNGGYGSWVICVPRKCTVKYDKEGPAFKDANLRFPYIPGTYVDYNNKISSVKTFNQCDVRFFGKKDFKGAKSTWIDQKGDLAKVGTNWNNRASSLKLS